MNESYTRCEILPKECFCLIKWCIIDYCLLILLFCLLLPDNIQKKDKEFGQKIWLNVFLFCDLLCLLFFLFIVMMFLSNYFISLFLSLFTSLPTSSCLSHSACCLPVPCRLPIVLPLFLA